MSAKRTSLGLAIAAILALSACQPVYDSGTADCYATAAFSKSRPRTPKLTKPKPPAMRKRRHGVDTDSGTVICG